MIFGDKMDNILILEDNVSVANSFKEILILEGYCVRIASCSSDFFKLYDPQVFQLLLVDIVLKNESISGLEILQKVKSTGLPSPEVIILSAQGSLDNYKAAYELGAFSFVEKKSTLHMGDFLAEVAQAIVKTKSNQDKSKHKRVKNLQKEIKLKYPLIGKSKIFKQLQKNIKKYAASDENIYIYGEKGSGKTSLAYHIYLNSQRFIKPFHILRLGSMTEREIECQLQLYIGHSLNTDSLILKADSGIIFFDEINILSEHLQDKLLDLLKIFKQGKTYLDVQFIFSSSENLQEKSNKLRYSKELFEKISLNTMYVPSLLERENDIIHLMDYYFETLGDEYGSSLEHDLSLISSQLKNYKWGGNVREVRTFCERITANVIDIDNDIILNSLHKKMQIYAHTKYDEKLGRILSDFSLRDALSEFEKMYIKHHLEKNYWKKEKTSAAIGIERTTLYKKMIKYKLAKKK